MPTRNTGKGKPKAAGGARGKAGGVKDSSKTPPRAAAGPKKTARSAVGPKTTVKGKAKPAAKSAPKGQAASGTATGGAKSEKTGTKPPLRKKADRSKRKKTGPGKATPFLDRARFYLTGLGLGLVLGILVAVAVFYLPEARDRTAKAKPSPPAATAPAPSRPERPAKPALPRPARPEFAEIVEVPPEKLLYEEQQRLEREIKKLEHGLFTALVRMEIPEKQISFLEVDSRNRNGRDYDHTLMRVNLPARMSPDQALAELQSAAQKLPLRPLPRLNGARTPEGMNVAVLYDGLTTHDINLFAALTPEVEPRIVPPAPPTLEKPGPLPRVALVIDDCGLSVGQADCFLHLGFPVALSILPFLPHSRDVAQKAHEINFPVMLHLPMEPKRWPSVDPGPGALMAGMSQAQIVERVVAAIDAVPYVVGVNNHMGSRFTALEIPMSWALEPLGERGLFFLDSRTSPSSKALDLARSQGIPAGQRSVFLDNIQEEQAIVIQLRKLAAAARKHGSAIGIGHVYPITCQVLKNEYNYLSSNLEIVPITTLIR
ncbi:MAG: divergent polysaccharide deacetylase family protein [Pseudomonadota bacterium]